MQIDWNATASVITAVATITLAILTAVYVKLTSDNVRKASEAIREQVRPYVFASIELEEQHGLILNIANIGKRIAYDVKISFKPEITKLESTSNHDQKFSAKDRLNHKSIAPGVTIKSRILYKLYFGRIVGFDDKPTGDIPNTYEIRVDYCDSQGLWYSELYHIDILALVKGRLYSDDPYIKKLESLSTNLVSISEELHFFNSHRRLVLLKRRHIFASTDEEKAELEQLINEAETQVMYG